MLPNKFLLFRGHLPYGKALKVQSWLLDLWMLEQKRLCATTFRVLEASFADGSIPPDDECLEYFQDLKALEAEGRYDCVLNQLYLSRKETHANTPADHSNFPSKDFDETR